jgi:hypothetical protein
MAMFRQQRPGPDDFGGALEAMRDPAMSRVLGYLARERSAAMPKIAFDLKMTITDAAKTVHDLQERGLVREAGAGGGAGSKMAQQQQQQYQQQNVAPAMNAFYILTERGLEATRMMRSK